MKFRIVFLSQVTSEQNSNEDRYATLGFTACSRAVVLFRIHSLPHRSLLYFAVEGKPNEDKLE